MKEKIIPVMKVAAPNGYTSGENTEYYVRSRIVDAPKPDVVATVFELRADDSPEKRARNIIGVTGIISGADMIYDQVLVAVRGYRELDRRMAIDDTDK